ncbi:MAG: flagellar M-ring protein FliF [Alphaproteobacteria bacterium]|nr:flagellar M-ring protein FliF [Alphaproteobacteria bacterium]
MNSFLTSLKNLGTSKIVALCAVALFLMGFLIFLATNLGKKEMAVLFNELDTADAKKIITKLEEQNVEYRLTKSGTEILVPIETALKLRVQLAETVGAGSVVGYEIFDKAQSPGVGQEVLKLQMLRALEGELSRTIGAIDHVKTARVHLVLPQRELFSKDEQKPSASVIIRMEEKFKLTPKNVEAIQKLVAAAVPKMETKSVSIMDTTGALLTSNYEDDEQAQMNSNEEMRRDQERRLRQAVQKLLAQSVGQEKVLVTVTLDMDFDQIVINNETYNPDEQVLRSSVTEEETSKTDEREPIVSVQENIPDAEGKNINQVQSQANRTKETNNYEISKKTTSQIRKQGIIKRISVAVIVDGNYKMNPDGSKEYIPRTEEELEQLATLTRSAVGYDADRGDVVDIVNMQFFNPEDLLRLEDPVLFMGFTKAEVMKMVEGIGVAIVSVLVILLVVRPLVVKAFEQSNDDDEEKLIMGPDGEQKSLAGPGGTALTDSDKLDDLIDIAKVENRVGSSTSKRISELIEEHPETAVDIIREWLYTKGNK